MYYPSLEGSPEVIVEGLGQITAEVVADSITHSGERLTTFKLHYPRFIHSEVMTHRMFSRNASSSRAIPVSAMLEQVRENPAMPIHWGANQAGMQAEFELPSAEEQWREAANMAADQAESLSSAGYHKQLVNRILEPYQFMNVILTATDFENFFWLRYHSDAQPEIQELARVMYEAREKSEPEILVHGLFHTPFVKHIADGTFEGFKYMSNGEEVSEMDALKISASCCAQVSYRKLDTSLDKALMIYDRLIESRPLHASPFEHMATPIPEEDYRTRIRMGLNMYDNDFPSRTLYEANFKGWTQYRKSLMGENATEPFAPTKSNPF